MKKTIKTSAFLFAALLLATSIGAKAPDDMKDFGQETVPVYKVATAPTLDGVVTAGEYNDAIRVLNYGDTAIYFNGNADDFTEEEIKSILPSVVNLYAAYDDNYFYIACENNDTNHYTPLNDLGVWDGDYLEFDIGLLTDDFSCYTDKLRLAVGMCSEDYTICTYSALNPVDADSPLDLNISLDDIGVADRNDTTGITTYEAAIPWSAITADGKAPEKAFFYYQFGVADEDYADRSEYEAYLGVYRYATAINDEALKEEVGVGSIPNIMIFSGDPIVEEETASTEPEVVSEEAEVVSEEAEVVSEEAVSESKTLVAPQTADFTVLGTAMCMLSGAIAAYAAKKKNR